MITSIIKNIVENQLTANSLTYAFSQGDNSFNNFLNDEIAKPTVHLLPPENDWILSQSGYIGEIYYLSLLFMFKSQLDWLPSEHEVVINQAHNTIRQFISLCQASELIDEVRITQKSVEFINLLNVNTSGKQLFINIKPNIEKSVCV